MKSRIEKRMAPEGVSRAMCEPSEGVSGDGDSSGPHSNPRGICLFRRRRNSASITAKARDLILPRSATADRGVRPSFLICREGHLDSSGVTQLCWHQKGRPWCTPTLAAGRANAPAIKTNQANTLRTRLMCPRGPGSKSMIFRLRPCQKVKQKQQYQRPKECEANVCQGTRGPDGAREKRDESVPKKLGQWFPRYRWKDVSHPAN